MPQRPAGLFGRAASRDLMASLLVDPVVIPSRRSRCWLGPALTRSVGYASVRTAPVMTGLAALTAGEWCGPGVAESMPCRDPLDFVAGC